MKNLPRKLWKSHILVLKLSDQPIVREVSQGWNINISYDKDVNIVQIVILEAQEKRVISYTTQQAA